MSEPFRPGKGVHDRYQRLHGRKGREEDLQQQDHHQPTQQSLDVKPTPCQVFDHISDQARRATNHHHVDQVEQAKEKQVDVLFKGIIFFFLPKPSFKLRINVFRFKAQFGKQNTKILRID